MLCVQFVPVQNKPHSSPSQVQFFNFSEYEIRRETDCHRIQAVQNFRAESFSRNFPKVNRCTNCFSNFLLFCTMTNKCTIISHVITLLHVSTLSCARICEIIVYLLVIVKNNNNKKMHGTCTTIKIMLN